MALKGIYDRTLVVIKQTRESYLNQLSQVASPFLIYWDDFDPPLHASFVLDDDGVYEMASWLNTYDGPFVISQRRYTIALRIIAKGRRCDYGISGDDGSDAGLIEMVMAGCLPEVPYYRYTPWEPPDSPPLYYREESAVREAFIADLTAGGEWTGWEDIDNKTLAQYCEMLDYLKQYGSESLDVEERI